MIQNNTTNESVEKIPQSRTELLEKFFDLSSDLYAINNCESMRSNTYQEKVIVINELNTEIRLLRNKILNTSKY